MAPARHRLGRGGGGALGGASDLAEAGLGAGTKGAAAGAAVGGGVRSVRVVGVQPAHHRLRVSARAHGDTRGATPSHDLVERQEALAGAPVGGAHRQPT